MKITAQKQISKFLTFYNYIHKRKLFYFLIKKYKASIITTNVMNSKG